jgi:putative GTP pyrophosphokinase
MSKEMSKTQVDRLGDRLKKGNITEADLRLLDQYRRSFTEAYEVVVGTIRKELALEPTGRPAKSTTSISEKLRRESIRLTQIQDIAGCRLIVSDIENQEAVAQSLKSLFESTIVIDRRQQPSHGYRAVHVIARCRDKMIEIQVRTSLQHLWAELSEKFTDVIDPAIKYGGGNETVRIILAATSVLVAAEESTETMLANALAKKSSQGDSSNDAIQEVAERHERMKQRIFKNLREFMELAEVLKGENDALSD